MLRATKMFLLASLVFPIENAASQVKSKNEITLLQNQIADYPQYEGQIESIIDADTIKVNVHVLPGMIYTINVRARGVNAPEMHGGCGKKENDLAEFVRRKVEISFRPGEWVYIENLENDSFGGRLVGDITQLYGNTRWRNLTEFLLNRDEKWAVPYSRTEKHDWCKD